MQKLNISKILIGSDFELFIVDDANKFISAIPLIEGTKQEPLAVDGGMIQHDGVLAEGGVPPVDINGQEEMWANMQLVLEHMKDKLPNGLKLVCCTNGEYESDQLQHPEAVMAGCEPDYCALDDGMINEKPNLEATGARCAGGHLHISHPGFDVISGMRLIRILDVNLALPLLFIDEDRSRRKLYGKASSFRFKDYGDVCGVEYRALSNIWIKDKEIFDFVWNGIKRSIDQYNAGMDYLPFKDRIQEAINNYNFDQAEQLCAELDVEKLVLQIPA